MFRDFFRCGLTGWCMEIIFTALSSIRQKNFRLKGITSLWMFPIYGCACLFRPLSRLLSHKGVLIRGLTYMGLIFSAEYISGVILEKFRLRPWNYENSPWNIRGNIRLDYAPLWFGAGLFFEKLLTSRDKASEVISVRRNKSAR